MPWAPLLFVIVVFSDHTHSLFLKCLDCSTFYYYSTRSLIKSIMQEHDYFILFIYGSSFKSLLACITKDCANYAILI